MESLKKLIVNNLSGYSELTEYNEVVIDFIKSYTQKRPDMCIEGCKSLIEGISKLIYFNIDNDNKNLANWRYSNFKDKFTKAIEVLKLNGYEEEFIKKNAELIKNLGQIRNDRGDIAHGQSYPKKSYSDIDFAKFITLWTEGLCYFLLSNYFICKQKDTDSITSYSKEQFEEFDNYLDDVYSEMDISYSKALKEQDSLKYELLMDEFYKNNYGEKNE